MDVSSTGHLQPRINNLNASELFEVKLSLLKIKTRLYYKWLPPIQCLHDLPSLSPKLCFLARSGPPFLERSHWMGMPRITNGGPERARKQTLGQREGRSCKHRINQVMNFQMGPNFIEAYHFLGVQQLIKTGITLLFQRKFLGRHVRAALIGARAKIVSWVMRDGRRSFGYQFQVQAGKLEQRGDLQLFLDALADSKQPALRRRRAGGRVRQSRVLGKFSHFHLY